MLLLDTTGSVPPLGDGQGADQRVALRTNAPRKTTGTGAGERGPGAGNGAGHGPETEREPGNLKGFISVCGV